MASVAYKQVGALLNCVSIYVRGALVDVRIEKYSLVEMHGVINVKIYVT